MILRPTRSVTYPKTNPPTKIPISAAAPIKPTLTESRLSRSFMETNAMPMMVSANPSRNGPPAENTVSRLWNAVSGPSSINCDITSPAG